LHTAYAELGINNSTYSYSAAGYPNNGFSTPLATFVESYGGPLVLGSWDSQKISFIVNGAVNTSDAMTVETTGAVTIPSVAVTGGVINNATIGATTPSTGTFTTLIGGGSSANYGQLTGGATTKAVEFKTIGSDTNVGLAIRSQGTGAIDLASGSSGVNISNGGTVTAITRTASGSGYTSIPSLAISAPTTAGGVQAIATPSMLLVNATIQSGGTGYTAGDTLTVVGGTGSAAILTVSTVSSGVITAITINSGGFGNYSVLPTNPVSVTGGTGSSATFNLSSWGLSGTFNISNAGSGYVEQPTITFSSGSATAYATVGSISKITSIGGDLSFYTPGGEAFRVTDSSQATVNYITVQGATSTGNTPQLLAAGTSSVLNFRLSSKSSGSLLFATNSNAQQQMAISHTASAVNYVQVTGATTASKVVAISAQGSDTDVTLSLSPKGAGTIRFGTYTVSALLPVAGYITITDSGGTSRRLLVG